MDTHRLVALYFRHAPQETLAAKYINPTLCVNSMRYRYEKAKMGINLHICLTMLEAVACPPTPVIINKQLRSGDNGV